MFFYFVRKAYVIFVLEYFFFGSVKALTKIRLNSNAFNGDQQQQQNQLLVRLFIFKTLFHLNSNLRISDFYLHKLIIGMNQYRIKPIGIDFVTEKKNWNKI